MAQVEGTGCLGSLVAFFALGILVFGHSIIGRSEVRSGWAQDQSIGHMCSLVAAWSQLGRIFAVSVLIIGF